MLLHCLTSFSVSKQISTYDYADNHSFVYNVLLKPIPEAPIVLPDILYDLGKWNLKPQYQDSLMVLVKILNDNPNLIIELRSHTDSRASLEFNDELSQKRAQTVVDFLVDKGIEPGRLKAKGYGERVPRTLGKDFKVGNYTFKKGTTLSEQYINKLPSGKIKETAYELNRRTDFVIIAKDYVPANSAADSAVITLVNDSLGMVINYTLSGNNSRIINCYINGFQSKAIINDENNGSSVGEEFVIELMKQGAISKEDFEGNVDEILKNNHIKDNATVEIQNLRIGDKTIQTATFKVKRAVKMVTLGKSNLQRFGNYIIDDLKKQIIFR